MSIRSWLALVAATGAVLLLPVGPAGAVPAEPSARASIPRTYAQAEAHFQNATKIRVNKKFYTPSGNIYCNVGLGSTPRGCEIGDGRIQDADACRGNPMIKSVGRIVFWRSIVIPVCNTDTIRTSNTRVLPYGQAMVYGNISCLSEAIGVTCLNEKSRIGFFLHRGEYVLFSD